MSAVIELPYTLRHFYSSLSKRTDNKAGDMLLLESNDSQMWSLCYTNKRF